MLFNCMLKFCLKLILLKEKVTSSLRFRQRHNASETEALTDFSSQAHLPPAGPKRRAVQARQGVGVLRQKGDLRRSQSGPATERH